MSGGHFFDIFWTFFQRQPQHQDTFQTLFGHFSGRLPGSPKRHFGTLFGHSSAISRFDPFYELRCFPFFVGSSFFFSFLLFLSFRSGHFSCATPAQDTFQTLFGHFSGRLPGSPKSHFGTLVGHFRQFLVLTHFMS